MIDVQVLQNTRTVTVALEDIRTNPVFRFSDPLPSEYWHRIHLKYPTIPLVILNSAGELIFCEDFLRTFSSLPIKTRIQALMVDAGEKDALILAGNLRQLLEPMNLYEKLAFLQRLLPLAQVEEIYSRCPLDLRITNALAQNLAQLLTPAYSKALRTDRLTLASALKILTKTPSDQQAILSLLEDIPFSASHQQILIEYVEEIVFRDKTSAAQLFTELGIPAISATEKPQKAILQALFACRYPKMNRAREDWELWLKSTGVPRDIGVTHHPSFETRAIKVQVELRDPERLRGLISFIQQWKDP